MKIFKGQILGTFFLILFYSGFTYAGFASEVMTRVKIAIGEKKLGPAAYGEADRFSEKGSGVLKAKGWEAQDIAVSQNEVALTTKLGESLFRNQGGELSANRFRSIEYNSSSKPMTYVTRKEVDITPDLTDKAWYYNRWNTEYIKLGKSIIVDVPGSTKTYKHTVDIISDNSKGKAAKKAQAKISLYVYKVPSETDVPINDVGNIGTLKYDKPTSLSELIIEDLPADIKYHQVREVDGHILFEYIYRGEDKQLYGQRIKITTDKDGKNPVPNKIGGPQPIVDSGQFNLQAVTESTRPNKGIKGTGRP